MLMKVSETLLPEGEVEKTSEQVRGLHFFPQPN